MRKYLLLLFIIFSLPSFAQKQIKKQNGFWLGYFNRARLTDKWGIWLDVHAEERTSWTAGLPN
jgi:hypothetical protein